MFLGIRTKELKKIIAFVIIFFMCTTIMNSVQAKAETNTKTESVNDDITFETAVINEMNSNDTKIIFINLNNLPKKSENPLLSEKILNSLKDNPDIALILRLNNKKIQMRSLERQIQFTENDIVFNGFTTLGNAEYYFDIDGFMKTGWVKTSEDNKWYHLSTKTGIKDKNWFKDTNGNWYYLDKISGEMKTGWIQDGEKWYYLYNNGILA